MRVRVRVRVHVHVLWCQFGSLARSITDSNLEEGRGKNVPQQPLQCQSCPGNSEGPVTMPGIGEEEREMGGGRKKKAGRRQM